MIITITELIDRGFEVLFRESAEDGPECVVRKGDPGDARVSKIVYLADLEPKIDDGLAESRLAEWMVKAAKNVEQLLRGQRLDFESRPEE